ncbi:MAG: glutamine--fructose-6-phosphate transaminase (isomerizing) [Deltaproteobacteria bacterium]|nr:glutamine--fructose-6-phosphate transaminase (isomerizing) [Deltaproteobacteria bacterium]
MCGIIAYVGDKPCAQLLIDGLRKLEYRGYDSAGVAVHDGTQLVVRRAAGKLQSLQDLLIAEPIAGTTGIGHTRWATHGPPSERNAHPHVSGRVAVVHNGIIENHVELKQELEAKGRVFASDTDTEIVAHLVELALGTGASLLEAVRQTLRQLRGAYAIAVLSREDPEKIIVARHASPLVLALADGAVLAASDVPAILAHTREVLFLEDNELAVLSRDGAHIETVDGVKVERAATTIRWSLVQAERGGYKHFMLKEIHEQPRAIEDTLRGRIQLEHARCVADELGVPETTAKAIRRVVLLACGTSFHAAMYGRYLIESIAKIPAVVDLASEFRYRDPVICEGDLVIAVSQSGETADTLAALKEAQRQGANVLGVVNVQGSAIARISNGVLYTHAGPEIGVASTKCFTAQLAAMALVAIHLGRTRGSLSEERASVLIHELVKIPEKMRAALEQDAHIQQIARDLVSSHNALFLGRGVSCPVALEGALKLKEISYVHAEGYAGGEMKHGPLALVDKSLPVVCLLPDDPTLEKMLSNVQEVRARDGQVLAIVNDENTAKSLAKWTIVVPKTEPELSPLITTIPMQLLSYHVADQRGTDVDQPRNLAKTVTVE